MRYIDLLLNPNKQPQPTEQPSARPHLALQYLQELYKSEGWKMFREMVEPLIFDWERQLVEGTGTAEKDAAVRAALRTAIGFVTWPEREAHRQLEWMETVKNAGRNDSAT